MQLHCFQRKPDYQISKSQCQCQVAVAMLLVLTTYISIALHNLQMYLKYFLSDVQNFFLFYYCFPQFCKCIWVKRKETESIILVLKMLLQYYDFIFPQ